MFLEIYMYFVVGSKEINSLTRRVSAKFDGEAMIQLKVGKVD